MAKASSADPNVKKWIFPLSAYAELQEALKKENPRLNICGIPMQLLELAKRVPLVDEMAQKDVDLSVIEPNIFEKLLPFQREGVK